MKEKQSRIGYAVRLSIYIKGMKKYLFLSVLFNFLFKIAPIVTSLITSYMVSSVIVGNVDFLGRNLVVVGALVLCSAVFAYLDVMVSHDMTYRILAQLRGIAYDKIDELSPAALEGKHSAALTNTVLEDVEQLEWFYAHVIGQLIVAVTIPVLALVLLGICSPILPCVLLPFILMMVCMPLLSSGKANTQGAAVKKTYADLSEQVVDGTQGIKDIISFGWQDSFFRRFRAALRAHQDAQMGYAVRSGEENGRMQLLIGLGALCGEIAAAYLVASGSLTAAMLVPVFQLCSAIFIPLQDALSMSTNYGLIFGAAKRLFELLESKAAVKETDGAVQAKVREGEKIVVSFEHVAFTYPSGEMPVLKDVSFSFSTGETVALVGTSGSGKTTVSRLLQRFWDVDSGKITVNGIDLKQIKLDSLRDIVTVVPQEVYLFCLNVAENLRLAKQDATEEEIVKAACAAQADGFIRRLPQGYDTLLGERGLRLSGGERQRLSIAQAFLKNSPVLILDEASANLDSETERQVNEAVNSLKKGRATMVIAHRLSTIKNADRILVLHGGVIEAEGTYEELLERNTYFKELVGGGPYG